VGWRLDYFGVSNSFLDRIESASIYQDIHGSDHCPVGIVLK
jgi:exodeoxyribonuclease-3